MVRWEPQQDLGLFRPKPHHPYCYAYSISLPCPVNLSEMFIYQFSMGSLPRRYCNILYFILRDIFKSRHSIQLLIFWASQIYEKVKNLELEWAQNFLASSGFEFRGRVGLGFPKCVFKPIWLPEVTVKIIVVLVIEPIGVSAKPTGFLFSACPALSLGLRAQA